MMVFFGTGRPLSLVILLASLIWLSLFCKVCFLSCCIFYCCVIRNSCVIGLLLGVYATKLVSFVVHCIVIGWGNCISLVLLYVCINWFSGRQ